MKANSFIGRLASLFMHSNRPATQIVLMFVTASIFYGVSFWPKRKFLNFDPSPSIEFIQSAKGVPVRTGMYVRNFMQFDTLKNEFLIDAVVWFECDKSVSIKTLEKFVFGKGEIKEKSEAMIKDLPNNKQFVWYNVRLLFPSNLNHTYFPFGDHTLFINLTNSSANIDEIYFVSDEDNLVVAESIYTIGWRFVKKRVTSGTTYIELDKKDPAKNIYAPRTIFALDFKDISAREVWIILFPLLIFFFVALFTFSVSEFTTRASIVTASLSAVLSYKYVIESIAPKVEYTMFSDYIFYMFLFYVFLAVIISLFIQEEHLTSLGGLIVILFHICLNFSWVFLIFYYI